MALLAKRSTPLWCLSVAFAVSFGAAAPGYATNNPNTVIKISEVFQASATDPNIQWVVLRAYSTSPTPFSLDGYALVAHDASETTEIGRTTLSGNFDTNYVNGAPILIASDAATVAFSMCPDFDMRSQPLPALAGELLVENPNGDYDDIFLWGRNVAPVGLSNGPWNNTCGFSNQMNMVAQAFSVIYQPYWANPNVNAQSAGYFWNGPGIWPQNNAGLVGVAPTSTCGNNIVEGLEQCDEVSPACSSKCTWVPAGFSPPAICGDGNVGDNINSGMGEECDDGNTSDVDGCSSICQLEKPNFNAKLVDGIVCGNGILEGNEECDGGTHNSSTTCTAQCQLATGYTPSCGDLILNHNEQCDKGSSNGSSDCDANCRWTPAHVSTCGNRILELGEQCDDGDTTNRDGCSSTCTLEISLIFRCGDGELDPYEQCDNGTLNGTTGNACTAACILVTQPAAENCNDIHLTTTTTGGTTSTTSGGAFTTTGGTSTTGTGGATNGGTGDTGTTGGNASATGGTGTSTGGTGGTPSTTGTTTPPKHSGCAGATPDDMYLFGLLGLGLLAARRRYLTH